MVGIVVIMIWYFNYEYCGVDEYDNGDAYDVDNDNNHV